MTEAFMVNLPPNLAEATLRFEHVSMEIQEAYASLHTDKTNHVAPSQLIEAVNQFLGVIVRLDKEEGETGKIVQDNVTELGDYGMTLLLDLEVWAEQLKLPSTRRDLEIISLAAADWVMRHEGQLGILEPVVNVLAGLANRVQEPEELEPLARFMGRIIQASNDSIKQDQEKNNPGRPWRVLHINRGIVATRTHNPEIMEQVFKDLVRYLPEEAPNFFAEGMQQMEALNYPSPVRAVMGRYFDQWTRPRMH